MNTEAQNTAANFTRELSDEPVGFFINGDADSMTKRLSDKAVAQRAGRSVFFDVISGEVTADSIF